ncbi:hypothetical protein [Legionella oakridgensis]|uniref:Uncharacterized protein n=2 Tax=Legionella oakridgensis TaxID=29423 RepID=W0B8N2_9GAMM|nr:hypothetical protein [Legionella oakridgensis]AHE66888.1 hypothetical protein Loa_01335 [Legionella oakridgensis ATCC 33761 = DSM 21215]ETO93457.1 hypothetical protein LOR_46c07940 [Legionella oakridgensis RV-2-2007]KTD39775.1 hypothetical protein Loak_0882 [Legionella oakridgensis]STY19996.1 Uncharacterised protein [Legionella longbeachae]
MLLRSLAILFSCVLCFNPAAAFADDTKECNAEQTAKCERFCGQHDGLESCIIDITTRSGTCTCQDGASVTR